MEALALKTEVAKLIETLPEDKIRYVIQFARFIAKQDSVDKAPLSARGCKRLPLGFLKGKAKVSFSDDWAITDEELLGL